MTRLKATPASELARFLDDVEHRLRAGKGVRRRVPGGGRVQIDRPMPFLTVFRRRWT